jgi:hypothetical protein
MLNQSHHVIDFGDTSLFRRNGGGTFNSIATISDRTDNQNFAYFSFAEERVLIEITVNCDDQLRTYGN